MVWQNQLGAYTSQRIIVLRLVLVQFFAGKFSLTASTLAHKASYASLGLICFSCRFAS
jgi:hypothetical protein